MAFCNICVHIYIHTVYHLNALRAVMSGMLSILAYRGQMRLHSSAFSCISSGVSVTVLLQHSQLGFLFSSSFY